MICEHCGKDTNTRYNGLCEECHKNLNRQRVEKLIETAKKPSDYKEFSADDLSDAFWISLGRYMKHPNKRDLARMYDMFLWACHDSHAQSRNFSHALEWCNIDLWVEGQKDLPEE